MLRYAITDRRLFPGPEPARRTALLHQAQQLAAANIDVLQLREKDLAPAALTALARDLLTVLRPARTRLLINTHADIAIATAADGVHLGSTPGNLTPAQIRQLYTQAALPSPTISLSCHTLADIARATTSHPTNRPNLILFGPVFEKRVAGELISPGTGLALLAEACV